MIGWGMKKHFTKRLAVIFAVPGVYFLAFKVMMKVVVVKSEPRYEKPSVYSALHRQRWQISFRLTQGNELLFAPLVWMERRFLRNGQWEWDGTGPEPNWVKEYKATR